MGTKHELNIDPVNHPNEKRCTKCREWKAHEEYYKDKRASDGRASQCRICNLGYQNKEPGKFTHIRNRPQEPEGMRWCSHCEKIKLEEEFSVGRKSLRRICNDCKRKDGVDYGKTHKEERAKYKADHYDEFITRDRAYYWRNKEKDNARAKEWRKNNPTKFRMGVKRAKAKKPDLYRANEAIKQSRRRQRLNELPNDFTIYDWERALEYFNGRCAVCNRLPDKNNVLHIAADHWLPLAKNTKGTVVDNIIPLCHNGAGSPFHGADSGCNNRKSAKDPVQWLKEVYDEITSEEILRKIEEYFVWAAQEKAKVTESKEKEHRKILKFAKKIENKQEKRKEENEAKRQFKLPHPSSK